jgi:MFS family permease
MTNQNEKKSYSRWLIVFLTFYSCCLHSGCLIYAFGLFVKPIQAYFGWDRATITLAFTLQFICIGVFSPLVGRAVDRMGPRTIISTGAVVAVLGFLSLPLVKNILHFYFFNIIIGIGSAAMGPVSCSTAVSAVFKEKRGLAIGIMSTGIGVGGFLFSPLIGGWLLPEFGWKGGYLGIAVAHAMIIPLAFLILKRKTQSNPSETEALAGQSIAVHGGGMQNKSIWNELVSAPFFFISIAFFLFLFSLVGTLQSQGAHLQDIGFPLLAASSALGALGLVSSFAKLFFGWLCDKLHPKMVFCIGAIFLIGGISLLMVVKPNSSPVVLWSYAIIFGIGVGCWLPIMSMMVSTIFGIGSYGLFFGGVALIQNMGSATGPLAAGYIYDLTKTYDWAFVLFLVLAVCSVPVILGVRPIRRHGKLESKLLHFEGRKSPEYQNAA